MDRLLFFDDPGDESYWDRCVLFCAWINVNPRLTVVLGLVAYRLWKINNKGIKRSNKRLYPVLLLIVESGAIYSAALLVLLILYKSDSWFQYVILDAVSTTPLFFSNSFINFLADFLSCRKHHRLPPVSFLKLM